uniref:Uncharacterized protein n=1 Tax=Timema shepardi TaxID=629360 RepID=A0A7R9B0M7_TIMSH|nr:unnamed protein product [Timema shepardi]
MFQVVLYQHPKALRDQTQFHSSTDLTEQKEAIDFYIKSDYVKSFYLYLIYDLASSEKRTPQVVMSREFEFILRKGSARNGTDHAIFEEERLKLEERFAVMIRSCREEEEVRLLALRDRYEKFLRDDRRRRDRNERILQTLDRIENRSVVLAAKTDRLRLLRRHYETYVAHVYPSWKPQGSDSTPVRSHVIQRPNLPTAMAVSNITNIASPRTSVPLYPITDVKTTETITSTHLEGVNSRQILPTSQVSGLLAHSARPDINIKDPEGKPLMHTHAIGSSVLKYIAIGNRQGVLPEKPPFLGPDIHDNSPTSYKANHYIDQAADLLKFNRDEAQPSTFVKGLHSNLGSTNDISKLNVDSKLGNSVDFEMEQNTSKDLLNVSLSDDGIIQEETDMANPSLPPSKDHKAEDSNLKVRFDTSGGPSELAGRLKDIEVNKSTRHSSDIINSQHKLSNVHKEGLSALKPTQFVPELDIDCGGGGDTSRDVKEIPGLSLNQRNVESYHLNSNADLSRRGEPSMSTNEDYSGINVGSSHHEGDRHTTANKECLESKKDAKNNDPKMLAVMQEKRMLKEPPINNFHNVENIKRTSNLGNIIVQSNEMDKDWQVSSVQKEIVGKPSQYQQEVDPKLFNLNKNELYENASDQKLQRQKTEENQVKQSDVEIINIHSSGGQQVLLEQTQFDHKKSIPVQPKQYKEIIEPETIHRLKEQYLTDEQSQDFNTQRQYLQSDDQGQYLSDKKGQYITLDDKKVSQKLNERTESQHIQPNLEVQPSGNEMDDVSQHEIEGKGPCLLNKTGQHQQLNDQGQYQQLDEQGKYQQLGRQEQYRHVEEQGQYRHLDEQESYQQLDEQGQYQQLDDQGQYQHIKQLDEQGQYQQLDEQGQYQQLDNQNQHPIGEQIHYQVDGQGEYVLDEKVQCLPLDHQGQYQHTIDTSTNQPDDQGQNKLDNASELQQQEVFESEETEYHQPQDNAEDIDQNSVTQGPVEQIVDVIGIQSSELPKETLQQYRSLLGVTAEPSSEMTGYSDGDEVEDHLAALVMQHQISSVDTQMSPGTTNLKDIHQTKNIDAIQGKMSALSSGGLSLQMMDVLGGLGQDLASDDSSEIQGPPRNITQGSGGIKPIIQSNLTQEESVLPRLQGSGNTICRDTQLLEQPNLVTTVETKPSEDIKASHKSDSDKPKTFKPVSKKLPDLTKMLESDSDSLQLDVNATLSNVDSDDFDFSSETQ